MRFCPQFFEPSCTTSMCPRDILFGAPTRLTGIKQNYQTNRHRTIEFSITILLTKFSSDWRTSLISQLTENFQVEKSLVSDDETFIHVFLSAAEIFHRLFPTFCLLFSFVVYISITLCPNSKWSKTNGRWLWQPL